MTALMQKKHDFIAYSTLRREILFGSIDALLSSSYGCTKDPPISGTNVVFFIDFDEHHAMSLKFVIIE